MGRIINTAEVNIADLKGNERYWVYNGMDCCVTTELFENLDKMRDGKHQISYDFVRSMQAPALAMGVRGFHVDQRKKIEMIGTLEIRLHKVEAMMDKIAQALWGKGLNPNSPKQLLDFFYGVLQLPLQTSWKKGKKVASTDMKAMENLWLLRPDIKPIFSTIIRIREIRKQIGMLKTGVDPDGRMRCSYNVAGTETGRWSSNSNPFSTGTNLQNITDKLRKIFEADKGWKIGYLDLEQAESRAVAYLSGDEAYINACESGDLHTTVAQMVWPDLAWTGVLAKDKDVAEQPFYRHFSYRDLSKRGGHGTNYLGQPRTMAGHLKVETKLIEDFQFNYFRKFPGIRLWHTDILRRIQTKGFITTPLGRRRYFLGRKDDNATWREAVAFEPQSTIGEILNCGLYRMWEELEIKQRRIKILAQVHDAVLFLYRVEDEATILPIAKAMLEIPIPVGKRTLIIPAGTPEVGWNWGKYKDKDNPMGLRKWKGSDDRNASHRA